jgi:hypothetical protein
VNIRGQCLIHNPSNGIRDGKRNHEDADASRYPFGKVIVVSPALDVMAGDEELDGGNENA